MKRICDSDFMKKICENELGKTELLHKLRYKLHRNWQHDKVTN